MKPFLVYTACRLGIFVGLAALLWVVGLSGPVLYLAALALSLPVSLVALGRQRAALSAAIEHRLAERRSRRQRLRSRLRGEEP